MAEFDLNLSTRPFPAYRLVNIVLAVGLVVLVVLSAWQATGFIRFTRLTRSIRLSEIDLRVEAESLGKRVADLESRLDRPEATAKLNEIGFLDPHDSFYFAEAAGLGMCDSSVTDPSLRFPFPK